MKRADRPFTATFTISALTLVASVAFAGSPEIRFRRGDANGDATFDIADPVFLLAALFTGAVEANCDDASDANDDGAIDISDPIRLLNVLFSGGTTIPPPGTEECGIDPTADDLGCARYLPCALALGDIVDVAEPARAAMLSDSPEVAVRGTVLVPDRLDELRVNGSAVNVGPDGTFEHFIVARHGVNVLRFEVSTTSGVTLSSVRSFLWSREYRPASDDPELIAIHRGGSFFLGSELIDDQVRADPPDDLAHVAELALAGFSPSVPLTLFSRGDSDCTCTVTPPRVCSWVRVTGSNLAFASPEVHLTPLAEGRLRAVVTVESPRIDLRATGEVVCVGAGPFTGSIRAERIIATAVLRVEAHEDAPEIVIESLSTDVEGARITIDLGPLTGILSDLASTVLDIFEADLEDELAGVVARDLPSVIDEALTSIAFSTELAIPPPPEATITLGSKLESINVESAGITLNFDTFVTSETRIPLPGRGSIISPVDERTTLPTDRPVATSLAHDALNQLLYAAWKASPAAELGPGLPVSEAVAVESFTATPLLPLVLLPGDSTDAPLRVETGDVKFAASLVFFGASTLDVSGFLSGGVSARLVPGVDYLGIALEDLSWIAVELTSDSTSDDLSGTAAALEFLLPSVCQALCGDVLSEIALPTLPLDGVEWRASDTEVTYGDAHVYLKGEFGP